MVTQKQKKHMLDKYVMHFSHHHARFNIHVAVAKALWMHLQNICCQKTCHKMISKGQNDTHTNATKERKPSDSYPRQGLSWICAGLVAWKPLEGGFPTGGTLRSSACLLWRCSPYIDQRCLRYHPEITKLTLNFTKTKWKHETLEWNFRRHTGTI